MPFINDSAFSVYAKARPTRIAFLIDPVNAPQDLLDALYCFNLVVWGGRYNPIIPVVDGDISASYWELLLHCDPDIVYSYITLKPELIAKISRYIAPYDFLYHRNGGAHPNYHVEIQRDELNVYNCLKSITKNPDIFSKATVCVANYDQSNEYFRLMNRNFGISEATGFSSRIPANIDKTIIDKGDDLEKIFDKAICKTGKRIFPIQFCECESDFQENYDSYKHDPFMVVVGEDVWDWIFLWNRIFLLSQWKREQISQICLPLSFFDIDNNVAALRRYLSSVNYRIGSHPPTLMFASHSAPPEALRGIITKFAGTLDAFPVSISLKKNEFPKIKSIYKDIENSSSVLHSHKTGNKTFIDVPQPIILQGSRKGIKYMMDLKIEYRPEQFNYTNQTYYWILPKRIELPYLFMRRAGKVSNNGLISFQVETGDRDVELNIPSDRAVFDTMFIGVDGYYYTHDIRVPANHTPKRLTPYDETRLSDKGKYARGLIGLFDSLWHASVFIQDHYWRGVLEYLCHRSNEQEAPKIESIRNKLDKIMGVVVSGFQKDPEKSKTWLAKYILKSARHQNIITADISFGELLKRLSIERAEFLKKQQHPEHFIVNDETNKTDLVDALSGLTCLSVFLQGVKATCRSCGTPSWYAVDQLGQELQCPGCLSTIRFPVEAEWIYKLNELIKNAISYHGVLPIVWAIGHLLEEWGPPNINSFIYIPGITFYKEHKCASEIDIACIKDGHLLLVEIKTSADEFSSHDINKLCDLCVNIRPDTLVLGAFNGPYEHLDDMVKEAKAKLDKYAINVKNIQPHSHVFDPSFHL